jgi:hypothetical protein
MGKDASVNTIKIENVAVSYFNLYTIGGTGYVSNVAIHWIAIGY